MSNIDNMLASIINKDEDGFVNSFADEMKERLATSLINNQLNISKDILSNDVEEETEESIEEETEESIEEEVEESIEEEVEESIEEEVEEGIKIEESTTAIVEDYTFKSSRDSKEFLVALSHMGIKKNNISQRGKTVSVSGLKNKNTLNMIRTMAKDMKASIKEENIVTALKEAYQSENGVFFTLKDSYDIHILPEDAESIILVHDQLSLENQKKLRDALSEDEHSFKKVLNFCEDKSKEV